jgi:hypothetical protein
MGRVFLISLVVAFIAGCSAMSLEQPVVSSDRSNVERAAPRRSEGRFVVKDGAGEVEVQKMEFRAGASSTTVERLAKAAGCTGSEGAGLVTEKGPIEIYRMQCDNGKTYMARCELRQCKPMR